MALIPNPVLPTWKQCWRWYLSMQKGGPCDEGLSECSTSRRNLLPVAAAVPKDVSAGAAAECSALPVPTLGQCAHTTVGTTCLGLILGFLALACSPAGTGYDTKQDSVAFAPLQPQAGRLF